MSQKGVSTKLQNLNSSFRKISIVMILVFGSFLYSTNAFAQKARSNRVKMDFSTSPASAEAEPAPSGKNSSGTSRQKQSKVKRGSSNRQSKTQTATRFTPLDREYDYSKPPYFGHKRPVVIRPPGLQKMCRVCGIMH